MSEWMGALTMAMWKNTHVTRSFGSCFIGYQGPMLGILSSLFQITLSNNNLNEYCVAINLDDEGIRSVLS